MSDDLRKALAAAYAAKPMETLWGMESRAFEAALMSLRRIVGEGGWLSDERGDPGPCYTVSGSVAVMPVQGVMTKGLTFYQLAYGGHTMLELARACEEVAADPKITGLVLDMDTPGGTVAGSSELAEAIRAVKAAGKPVVARVSDLCASVGYYLAANADSIVADEDALVGYIGTYQVIADWSKAYEAAGVKVHVIRAGKFKGAGAMGTEVTPEQLAMWQTEVDAMTALFCQAVSRGRKMPVARVEELADGAGHIAAEALSLGLIDAIGNLDAALTRAGAKVASAASSASHSSHPSHRSQSVEDLKAAAALSLKDNAADITAGEPAKAPVSPGASGGMALGLMEDTHMDAELMKKLVAKGMKADATDVEAIAFIESLQVQIDAGKVALTADDAGLLRSMGVALEQDRIAQINGLAAEFKLGDAWALSQITGRGTVADAKADAVKEAAKGAKPVNVAVGDDLARNGLEADMADAIAFRANGNKLYAADAKGQLIRGEDGKPKRRTPSDRAMKFANRGLHGAGREYLRLRGAADAYDLSPDQLAKMLLDPSARRLAYPGIVGLSTSDFASDVLLDAMNKSMMTPYAEIVPKWPRWCRRGTAKDFRNINRVNVSAFTTLAELPEGKDIEYGTFAGSKEVYAVTRKAKAVKFTYEMLVNDDMDAFGRIQSAGVAAGLRAVDLLPTAILIANPLMADGKALFSTEHANIATGAGIGAPTTTTLEAMITLLGLQRDPAALAELEIDIAAAIAPMGAVAFALRRLAVAPGDPNSTGPNVPNIHQGEFDVVSYGRLARSSPSKWYVAGNPAQVDGIEVSHLNGNEQPQVTSVQDPKTLGVDFMFWITAGAKAIDYRGLAYNPG